MLCSHGAGQYASCTVQNVLRRIIGLDEAGRADAIGPIGRGARCKYGVSRVRWVRWVRWAADKADSDVN